METNSVRKLYIDSRFRLDGSKSSSDFEFELNRSITLPRNCAGFVTDIHLMHSWYNVDEHAHRLYYVEYWVDNQTPHTKVKRISLPMKHYTATSLKNELVSQLNGNKRHLRRVPEESTIRDSNRLIGEHAGVRILRESLLQGGSEGLGCSLRGRIWNLRKDNLPWKHN